MSREYIASPSAPDDTVCYSLPITQLWVIIVWMYIVVILWLLRTIMKLWDIFNGIREDQGGEERQPRYRLERIA